MNKLAINLPNRTGVYLFKNKNDDVIYTGKAKEIKKRVSSYFVKKQSGKAQFIVREAASVEYITTSSELEALLLECNLIKRYKPKYNVVLRDDKSYPYVAINGKRFPRVVITRRTNLKDTKYYGPFIAGSIKRTLEVLRRIFPFASCRNPVKGNNGRACLYYHIEQCAAPCIGAIGEIEYSKIIEDIELFLQGKHQKMIKALKSQMRSLSNKQQYENAGRIRDRLMAVRSIAQSQKVISSNPYNADIIGVASQKNNWLYKVFLVRDGKLADVKDFSFSGISDMKDAVRSFILQYYSITSMSPSVIYIGSEIKDAGVVELWLKQKFKHSIRVVMPKRGEKKKLVDMAYDNARQSMADQDAKKEKSGRDTEKIINELQANLELKNKPFHIECFDVSNIMGRHAVGSMITFVNTKPNKEWYRRFKLENIPGGDPGMMKELLSRRLSRNSNNTGEQSSWKEPDLIVVDGGLPQLNAALKALDILGKNNIDCIALAKKKEAVYTQRSRIPIQLPDRSNAKYLIMQIRDEAHRFAVEYHKNIRQKSAFESALDSIEGIGHKRRQMLLKNFSSFEEIVKGGTYALVRLGIPKNIAERIIKKLSQTYVAA